MTDNFPTLTHASDPDIYVPADIEISDLSFLGDLKDRYLAVREAISHTHESVRDMWGAIFEFSIVCLKKENSDAFKRLCELHGVTAKASSSKFNRAVKIAIGMPVWDADDDRMVFAVDDNQVARFCRIFDLAAEEFNITEKSGFVAWLSDESAKGGGGSISEALLRASDWAKRNSIPARPINDDFVFSSRLERLRTNSRAISKALFPSKRKLNHHGFKEGVHYSLTVSIVDGQPVLDAVNEYDEESFRKAIKPHLPLLEDEETPLPLSQFFKQVRTKFLDFEAVDVTIEKHHATVVSVGGDAGGDSNVSQTYFLGPQVKDTTFTASTAALKEIGLCTRVFSERHCRWQLRKTGISVELPDGLPAQKIEGMFNERQAKKIALDDRFVEYVNGGSRVSINFRPKKRKQEQVEFTAP